MMKPEELEYEILAKQLSMILNKLNQLYANVPAVKERLMTAEAILCRHEINQAAEALQVG